MKVCIAEKPSVAREIAEVLGATQRKDGYIEGNGYQVTWTFGHLCTLKEPHDYTPNWKAWSLSSLPMVPPRFGIKLISNPTYEQQFKVIESLMQQAEMIINCGDAGQEGELIQRWVMQKAGAKCPVYRLWISSLTEEAIREGFRQLKEQSEFNRLYEAGLSRAIGDWLLGMNATRLYTLRYGQNRQVLSIGRVQTPTLALIVNRQAEIDNFKPEPYWELKTIYRNTTFSATKGKFTKKEEGEAFLETVKQADFTVTDISEKKGKEYAPRLFDLTSLQVECNKKYAFTADDTLKLIQSLYEKKVTTYPRVDTTFLSEDIYPKVPATLKGLVNYTDLVQPLLEKKLPKSKRVFDNTKVTDHHAIIPTGVPARGLTDNEMKVYDLVARRFIAAFYPDCEISTTTVLGKVEKVEFKVTGKQILKPGWRVVFGAEAKDEEANPQEENAVLPDFTKGESGPHQPILKETWTTPPKPYTEATLLRAMLDPCRHHRNPLQAQLYPQGAQEFVSDRYGKGTHRYDSRRTLKERRTDRTLGEEVAPNRTGYLRSAYLPRGVEADGESNRPQRPLGFDRPPHHHRSEAGRETGRKEREEGAQTPQAPRPETRLSVMQEGNYPARQDGLWLFGV